MIVIIVMIILVVGGRQGEVGGAHRPRATSQGAAAFAGLPCT